MTIAIVLAAGKGTRMRSSLPKVAHKVAGLPMIEHIHSTILAVSDLEPLYVLGHGHDVVRGLLPEDVRIVVQSEQRGTGHAVSIALDALPSDCVEVLVMYGDMPLLKSDTLRNLRARHREQGASLTLLSASIDEPYGYGRIARDQYGKPRSVVEEKWLSAEQKKIREINTGLYVIDVGWLHESLPLLPRHGDDEIYLTDLAAVAAESNALLVVPDAAHDEVIGINDRVGLAHAEQVMRRRINEAIMRDGVTLIDPANTYIAADAAIGVDTVIEPNVVIDVGVTIGERCHIGAQSRIVASAIGSDCVVHASHIEFSELADHVHMGPFSHLRAGTSLGSGTHIGNFSEVKNSTLGERVRMGHFSYIGDSTVGNRVNVGAGTITANYDGTAKYRTTIEDDVFLGVGTLLRAPVTLGSGAITGAGSVVLQDVEADSTVAGVPARTIRRQNARTDSGRDSG
jgi:bifunctional UDP-N-acetylglucosamine pyrophosphorylase/glucosamine-1-phosphate N-acetyltransferase